MEEVTSRLLDSIRDFAIKAHKGQFRRSSKNNKKIAYIYHVYAVASRVERYGNDYVAAAYLHDVLEDTKTAIHDLIDLKVPAHVIGAVQLLTKQPWHHSYEDFIDNIKRSNNDIAIKVKIADMISNLSDEPTDKQIRKYSKALLELVPVGDL